LNAAPFSDRRHYQRLATTVETLVKAPAASVPAACGRWDSAKGTYRFWANPHVTAEQIRASHTLATVDKIRDVPRVLIPQDTTEMDFTAHPATDDLGHLSRRHRRGFLVHSALVLSEQGVPQGLLCQQVWTRDPAD